jgi:putative membrane protein
MMCMKPNKLMCCALLAGAAMMVSTSAMAQSDQDKQFLMTAAQGDQNEIALSTVAEHKATNPQVKAFARKMVTDHTQLTASMQPFAKDWSLTPPTGPDPEHQAELDKLSALQGAAFDKEYMNQMVMDHQKALAAFKTEESTTTDARFKPVVMNGEKVVAEHLKTADKLQSKMM